MIFPQIYAKFVIPFRYHRNISFFRNGRPKSTISFYNFSNLLWSFSTFHLKKTFVRKSFRKLIFMLLQWPKVLHCCKFELFITQWRIFFILLSFFLQTKWKVWRSLYRNNIESVYAYCFKHSIGKSQEYSPFHAVLFFENFSQQKQTFILFYGGNLAWNVFCNLMQFASLESFPLLLLLRNIFRSISRTHYSQYEIF